jgi:hypothetical protein
MRTRSGLGRTSSHLALVILLGSMDAGAQDLLTIGGASAAPGATVSVPIYVRDAGGTPLGTDRPAGLRIQALAFQVVFTPSSAVTAASIARAGITSARTPLFEASPTSSGTASWIASFSESSSALPFSPSTAGYGDLVATLSLTLAPGLAAGARIQLAVNGSTALTSLSNQAGTTLEAGGSGLSTVAGMVSVGPFWGDADLDLDLDVFDLTILASFLVGNVTPGATPFLGTVEAMNLDPALGPTVDLFDLVLLANAIVGNVPVLPIP